MRYYSAIAVDTSLVAQVSSSGTDLLVGSIIGYPTEFPFTIVVDPDTSLEELCEVSGYDGTTFHVTRGFDSTTPTSHSIGAVVKHVMSAEDLRETQQHMAATTDVHGVTGALASDTALQAHIDATENVHGIADTAFLATLNGSQALTNKDLTDGTNTFPSSLVTETGSQTLTNKTIDFNDNTITNLPTGDASIPSVLMLGGM